MKQNIYALISGKVKVSTKILFALFMSLPFLMQVDAVKNFLTPIFAAHPKIAATVSSLAGIALLLHNPQVQQALGITVSESKSTTVTVEPVKE